MENTVGSAIEKIKRSEYDKEAKLKEKREFEATVSNLSRTIREAHSHTEKANQEIIEMSLLNKKKKIDVEKSKINRDALYKQLKACRKLLDELRSKSDNGIAQVWNLRSNLCNEVQSVADKCDVWALLMKPSHTKPLMKANKVLVKDEANFNLVQEKLKSAIEKRDQVMNERDQLFVEPDVGADFVRIKNALRYSLEKVSSLQH